MHKSNVLIVDDSTCMHKLVRASLKPERVKLHSAYDGETALKQAAKLKPELILMDIEMPHIDGLEVGRRLKASPSTSQIPIVFLTADHSLRDKMRAFEMGASGYITKPFKPQDLCATVRAATRRRRDGEESSQGMADRLTGLFTRDYFETRLDGELARARRTGQPLGCALIDIDQMGAINIAVGAAAADTVLCNVGKAIFQSCRREDVVCRFDGDEFAVLANGLDAAALQMLAERIAAAIAGVCLGGVDEAGITASIGVATSRFSSGMSLVVEAAEALEVAQKQGGNRVVVGRELLELRLAG